MFGSGGILHAPDRAFLLLATAVVAVCHGCGRCASRLWHGLVTAVVRKL